MASVTDEVGTVALIGGSLLTIRSGATCGRAHGASGESAPDAAVVRARTRAESTSAAPKFAVCVQIAATILTDRPDPYRSVSRELLTVLADEGRPMSMRDLEESGRLGGPEAARRQLSVAR